jgi:hypothetical protein
MVYFSITNNRPISNKKRKKNNGQKKTGRRDNNDLQNTTQKTLD